MSKQSLKILKALAAHVEGAAEGEALLAGELLNMPNEEVAKIVDRIKASQSSNPQQLQGQTQS